MTTATNVQKIVCPRCLRLLDVGDRFCRQCGAPLKGSPAAASPARPAVVPAQSRTSWAENRIVVLVVLFLVLGPLGLPMLWRSRQFSLFWKVVLTTIVLGLTLVLVGLIWYVVDKMLEPLTEWTTLQNNSGRF